MKTIQKQILFFCSIFLINTAGAAVKLETTFVASGKTHKLYYSIPDRYDSLKSYPLVVGLHYCGGTALSYRNSLTPIADSLQMIIVCPDNSSNVIPDDQLDIVTAAADSARAAYNIDTTAMFLTGMSCNGEFTLRQGLLRFYPFAGIFPWVPWISAKKEFNKYLIESDMPTVLSVGTFDDNFWLLMDLFDSLKAEGADINLVLAPKIGHVEIFPEFGSTMIKCVQYLTTPDIISLSPVEKISLVNDEPARDILIDISTTGSEELCVSVMANSDLFIEVPVVVYDPANGKATVSITPRAGKKGKAKVIVEAYEKEGGAIAQTVFNLEVVKPSSSVFPEAESTRLLVLPNPANQYITIQSTTPIGAYQIFDLNGRLVHNGIELGTHAEVNVQSLPKGKYILTTKATSSPVKFSLK